ncbi:MAG TPA: hypothetical protein VIY08_03260 [Candidatus Nitrosocosmicus sp.]
MSNDGLDGHEISFMAALCQEFRIRQGAGNTESIILDEFLDKHFQGGIPHGFMLDRVPRLVERRLIEIGGRIVRLTQNGIDHCNTNVR